MLFKETPLKDAYLIDLDKRGDERGFFARLFCEKEFAALGLDTQFVQINNSLSKDIGTLRGLHYQLPPHQECKVVRCIQGALYDVIVDLRPESATYKKWFGVMLSQINRTMLYVPKGFAHGFVTLKPDTEILYLVSAAYHPDLERTLRWDDPEFSIDWPVEPRIISEKDIRAPDFDPSYHFALEEEVLGV